ncbi:flagellar basal-body rod protein FlgF [Legionella rowbothamii]|uniref:flagellar basal-body rod protein FlgF n=1 Tax=Legionella rowbothamii TaxID=96229 RepID=UPI001056860F|nr:flagellar basal-body rod protein FlgF [Legionella rowbothamii]
MDPILYNAANGGRSNFARQEVIANNLANVGTTGFRADMYQAQTLYVQGAKGGNNYGQSFTVQNPSAADFTPGPIVVTGRNLDVAVNGKGWLAVRGSDGKEAYTKAGSLNIDANGFLVTASGKQVIGNGGPISIPPATNIDIGTDGTITIVPTGNGPQSATTVDRIKMVSLDPAGITKGKDGLFQLKNGGVAPADNTLKLTSGALEGSNVQAVEQMVAMINAGRDFETHMNLLSTMGENAQKLTQLLAD